MKSEKLSTEIAALQRKQKETKNAVVKKALSGKIERLKKELDEITTTAQAKTALSKAQNKIREMSQKDFGEFIKKLAAKPEFSFLKGMSKSKIKDDIMRVAKPVGWRFRGRTNAKKPTRKDIKEGNNVYYEARVNRSDVSRAVRLGEGGGVGADENLFSKGEVLFLFKGKQANDFYKSLSNMMPDHEITMVNDDKVQAFFGNYSDLNDAMKMAESYGMSYTGKYAKGGGVGDEMARGGEIVPYIIWVSRDGNKRELYGEYKSKRAAQMAMNKLWEKGEYNSIGNMPKSSYEKEGFYYAKGGKTDFGMLSVKAGIDNNPNPTYADKIAGAKMNKMAKGGGVGFNIDEKVVWTYDVYDRNTKKDVPFKKMGVIKSYYWSKSIDNPVKIYEVVFGDGTQEQFLDKSHPESKRYFGQDILELSKSMMSNGGGVDMLHEDDFVWNALGKKLVVDKVTDDEYWLSGFMQPSASPFSKEKVHSYLKKGEWSLKPKMAKGGDVQSSEPHRLHMSDMMANGGGVNSNTYKLRAEGLDDFLAFLRTGMYMKIKSFTVEPIGVPDVVVSFVTDSSLSEIKSKLKEVPDSHVMLETIKPINQYTGKR